MSLTDENQLAYLERKHSYVTGWYSELFFTYNLLTTCSITE